jgi:hypothetical protein
MESFTKDLWQGKLQHVSRNMILVKKTETVNGDQFVHGHDEQGPFMALLHQHVSGEEWFHGPGMQAIYMSHFGEVAHPQ